MEATLRLPPELVEHARAFLADRRTPATPRDAATVVLLRQAAGGPEAYLIRRHTAMPFAAGMYAFPGGVVDPRDYDPPVRWTGPPPEQWAARLNCGEGLAGALVCAAVRETFEESGVLLAGTSEENVVADTTASDWEADRQALVAHDLAFAEFLLRRELTLRADLLAGWAHWTTPEFEPRRYDTRFFVAVMPAGQRTRDVSGEADRVGWLRPAAVLEGVDSGAMAMLPPTYVAMRDLATIEQAADALSLAAARPIRPIVPGVEIVDGEGFLTLPPEVRG